MEPLLAVRGFLAPSPARGEGSWSLRQVVENWNCDGYHG